MVPTVNVNTATDEELDAVPVLRGHGAEIARRRTERGRFTDLRQLKEVLGARGQGRWRPGGAQRGGCGDG